MCARKGDRKCAAVLAMKREAYAEWSQALTLHDVRACWGRLGGRVTLHRRGVEHYRDMARLRWSA